MEFEVKKSKGKIKSSYKTLYIAEDLIQRLTEIAKKNDTSFNNVVISMIEHCLKDE